jgi:general secretion pathway protein H
MPSRFSATAHPTACRSRGFTLIELLVVVVIIAVIASVAVLSVNALGRDTQLSEETNRLSSLLGMVREQAEMQHRDHGMRLEEARYVFLRFDVRTGQWAEVAGDRLLRARELPEGLRLRLWLDAREAVLRPLPPKKEKDKPVPPQIILFANGDLMDFELRLEREDSDHSATIKGSADGKLDVRTVDQVERR